MLALSFLLALPLVALSGLHLLWSLGVWFPARSEDDLVRSVVGIRDATRMPGPIPCILVAVALDMAAVSLFLPHGALRSLALSTLLAVLVFRGLLAFGRGWRRIAPQEPYATLDRTRYGPAALVMAAGVFVLLLWG